MSVLFNLIFVALNFLVVISASNAVPTVVWSRERTIPTLSGLKHYGSATFNELVHDALGKSRPVVALFLDDQLSMEDFLLRESDGSLVFQDFKEAISGGNVALIPSVESPSKVALSLENDGYNRIEFTGKVPTGLTDSTLIIVNLPNDFDKSRAENCRDHSEKIGKVYGQLVKAYPDLLAIYTGETSSHVVDKNRSRVRRADEPKPEEEKYILMRADNFVMIATGIEYKTSADATPVVVDQVTSSTLTVDNSTGAVAMKVSFPGLDVSFNFAAAENDHHWSILNVVHDGDKVLKPSVPIWGPRRWSWFCSNEVLFAQARNADGTDPFVLNITGLQVQPYIDETENDFGQAMDCIPYFSIAIWTGIFIVLLMLFILGWGLTMLMDINTNDRFDDPKGKTITISATD